MLGVRPHINTFIANASNAKTGLHFPIKNKQTNLDVISETADVLFKQT